MRTFVFVSILMIASAVYADRVCLEKSTGKLIEYQSGGTEKSMISNAKNVGYMESDVEVKEVTQSEWEAIRDKWIDAPSRKKRQDRQDALKIKETEIKTKLNMTDAEFKALKDVLKELD